MYSLEALKSAVKDFAENLYTQFSDDPDIEEVEIRLQLDGKGNYSLHSGDAQFDTDHRGYWGYGFVSMGTDTSEKWGDVDPNDYDDLADEIVNEAIDELWSNTNWKPLEESWGKSEKIADKFNDDYQWITDTSEIPALLGYIGVLDLQGELTGLFVKECDGEIVEIWGNDSSQPYLKNATYTRIRKAPTKVRK